MSEPTNRVYRVTVTDRNPDGTRKSFTMIASTSLEEATASARVRFGVDRLVSVVTT